MKLVSVIVPVYNMEKLLPRCIDSILGQAYSNIELILVNDGSLDQSGEICEVYKNADSRVVVLHKENSGIADASNMGLDRARGDFVLFVDSDDYIDEDMVQKLITVQEQTGADIVQTGMTKVNNSGVLTADRSFVPRVITSTEQIVHEFFCGTDILLCLASKLFKSQLFENYRFESGRNIIDILATPELLQKSTVYAITDGAGYKAYFREGSVSRGLLTDVTYDDCKYYLASWKAFLEKNYPDNEEYKALIYYRGAYEMAYKYPLLCGSPYVTHKSEKKREMRKIFLDNYKKLLKVKPLPVFDKKKQLAFKLFQISPALMQFAIKINSKLVKK